ncbi:MAG TPA: response regulator [Thermoguttaceae bacterium]
MTHAMEGVVLTQNPSVLIVDRSEETREVLQTVLKRRGVSTFIASHATEGEDLVKQHHPDLIVMDLEISNMDRKGAIPPFWASSQRENIPLILLGTLRRSEATIPQVEFVAKPYHYGPLIRRIEELLSTAPRNVARQV